MSKSKVRSSVSVVVEEIDIAPVSVAPVEVAIVDVPAFKSSLGYWWDCLAGLVLVQGFLGVFLSWSKVWEDSGIGLSFLILIVAMIAAVVGGRYAGQESDGRKLLGFLFVAAGLIAGVLAFALGTLPNSSPLTYAAIGLTITGWAMRRLLGESFLRCVSLGLVAALPLLFLDGGRWTDSTVAALKELVNASGYWFVGVLSDLYHVPFTPLDEGIKFATGELRSIAAFGNLAGILVALSLSIACSVIGRQAFPSALLSVGAAFMWWTVIRSSYCLNMATTKNLDGPLAEIAMPIYALVGLSLLIIATNLCLRSILSPIPIPPGQFEVSGLTQIYNAFVSFPQLGPAPPVVVTETAPEEPLTSEDLLLEEYKRAKEAAYNGLASKNVHSSERIESP